MSLTSLIDVIFLLLLFFMLPSTFSKFSEVELAAAGAGAAGTSDVQRSFLQLGENTLSLNGEDIAPEALADRFGQTAPDAETISVIVSMQDDVTAQRLTDILVVLRGIDRLKINVLGS
ncbi:MAG: biopolymer transporter ExbD [Pseudomonadota bacterium]